MLCNRNSENAECKEHRWLFHQGKDIYAYKYFGAHFSEENGVPGQVIADAGVPCMKGEKQ